MTIEPERVDIQPEGISIGWKDGHKSFYPSKYLRINCGCAGCVEEWSRRQILDPATVPADIQALDYMEVGRYALRFLWSDLHEAGIYPYEVLRSLCTCEACTKARA